MLGQNSRYNGFCRRTLSPLKSWSSVAERFVTPAQKKPHPRHMAPEGSMPVGLEVTQSQTSSLCMIASNARFPAYDSAAPSLSLRLSIALKLAFERLLTCPELVCAGTERQGPSERSPIAPRLPVDQGCSLRQGYINTLAKPEIRRGVSWIAKRTQGAATFAGNARAPLRQPEVLELSAVISARPLLEMGRACE